MLREVDRSKLDIEAAGDPTGSIFGLPYEEHECSLVLVPVPWEPTTSYGRGTAAGPEAIRIASPQLDLFDPELAELGIGEPWHYGIFMRPEDETVRRLNAEACRLADQVRRGDGARAAEALAGVNARSDELNAWVRRCTQELLDQDRIVGIVGGDHSVPFGAIEAHARRYPGMGILHVDAHADLRDRYEGFAHSHASIMRNVLAVEISLMGNEPSSPVIDVSVSYWPEGMGGPFYMSTDSGVAASVTFEGFSLGDEPSVSGSFSAVMCRHESMFAEADTDNCLPVEGRFDTRLRDAG